MGDRLSLLDIDSYARIAWSHIRRTIPRALEESATQWRGPFLLAILRPGIWGEVEIPGITPTVEDSTAILCHVQRQSGSCNPRIHPRIFGRQKAERMARTGRSRRMSDGICRRLLDPDIWMDDSNDEVWIQELFDSR